MIETTRLTLSPYTPADAPALARNVNCPEVASMLESVALPFTKADALARIEVRQCDERRFTFALREKATGEVVGEIAAAGTDGGTPRMGYHIWPERWGKGYASEAVPAGLGHAFDTLGWPRIEADAFDDNHASIRILERAGFRRIGSSTCGSPARDDDMTSSVFRLTRDEWATPVLKTARLTLRPRSMDDAERLAALIGDFEVSKTLARVPYPYTREMAEEWLSGALSDTDDINWIIDMGDGLCGSVGLHETEDGAMEMGFWLARPLWGQGYVTEAASAMIDWAFDARKFDRIVSGAFMDNIGSRRVHEKLGFRRTGENTLRSAARGETLPHLLYELTRQEWERRAR